MNKLSCSIILLFPFNVVEQLMRLGCFKQWLIGCPVIALISINEGSYSQVLRFEWPILAFLDPLQLSLLVFVDLARYTSPSLSLGAVVLSLEEFLEVLGCRIRLQRFQNIIELIILVIDAGLVLDANVIFEIGIILIHQVEHLLGSNILLILLLSFITLKFLYHLLPQGFFVLNQLFGLLLRFLATCSIFLQRLTPGNIMSIEEPDVPVAVFEEVCSHPENFIAIHLLDIVA